MKENSIEEDITKINTYVELVLKKDYCNCNELNTILGKHCDGSKNVAYAMQHILSDYKKVLKENEELKYKIKGQECVIETQVHNEEVYESIFEKLEKENLKKQCVQDLLLKENSIEITDADVDEEIQYYIDELGYKDKKEVLSAISEDEIHSELQYTKLMDALMKETTIK